MGATQRFAIQTSDHLSRSGCTNAIKILDNFIQEFLQALLFILFTMNMRSNCLYFYIFQTGNTHKICNLNYLPNLHLRILIAMLLDINIVPRLFARFNGSKFETLDMIGSPSATTANHHGCYKMDTSNISDTIRHRFSSIFLSKTEVYSEQTNGCCKKC